MKQFVGSVILAIGHIWVTISSCGTMIVGFLLWLGILIWLATSGGLIWAGLWLFIGGGLTAAIVGLISLPTRLFGTSLMLLGTRLQNPEDVAIDEPGLDDCMSCGSKRVSEDDQYCRICGQSEHHTGTTPRSAATRWSWRFLLGCVDIWDNLGQTPYVGA